MGIWDEGVKGTMGGGLMSCCMFGGRWEGHWDTGGDPEWWGPPMWGWGDMSPWPAGDGVVWWLLPGGGM